MPYIKSSQTTIYDSVNDLPANSEAGQQAFCIDTLLPYTSNGTSWIATPDFGLKKLQGISGTPSITLGTAAGATGTMAASGNNISGKINITTGTVVSVSGQLFKLTLADGLTAPNGIFFQFNAKNSNALSIMANLSQATTNNSVTITVSGSILSVSTIYQFDYLISIY